MHFYDLEVKTPQGQTLKMSDYKGQTVLIVNTATKCGLTPQFTGLEKLHKTYKDQGLVIIGMPCNQFLSQEPETNETMEQVCEINHGVTFQLTEKIKVNGKDSHPVFNFLTTQLKRKSFFGKQKRVKWNFTKFLIGPNGTPIKRFEPTTVPSAMEQDIKSLIIQKH